jgi:starvation-inducible DNA-binding protein
LRSRSWGSSRRRKRSEKRQNSATAIKPFGAKPAMIASACKLPRISAESRASQSPIKEVQVTNVKDATASRIAPLHTPTDLRPTAVPDLAGVLNVLLADMFALYLKTKNFHWHMSGPHFRDYHLLLDEHGDQIFATTDAIAERVRKVGGTTLHSVGQIGRLQRVLDNDEDFVTPLDMLAELRDDNKQLVAAKMGSSHYPVCPKPAITLSRKDWHSSANGAVV